MSDTLNIRDVWAADTSRLEPKVLERITPVTSIGLLRSYLTKTDGGPYIVVGQKGMGKTLFLAKKRELFPEQPVNRTRNELVVIPRNGHGEMPDRGIQTLPAHAFAGDVDWWRDFWLALATNVAFCVVSKYIDTQENKELLQARETALKKLGFDTKDSGGHSEIRLMFPVWLKGLKSGGRSVAEFQELYEANLLLLSTYPVPIRVFCDGIDQMMENATLEYRKSARQKAGTPDDLALRQKELGIVIKGWHACQAGMILAADQLPKDTKHRFQLYSTARPEGMSMAAEYARASNESATFKPCVEIAYTDEELARIFTDRTQLAGYTTEKPFLPAQLFPHWRAFGQSEFLIDGLIRHTMRRPRDLMVMGEGLANLSDRDRAGAEAVAMCINTCARAVFDTYQDTLSEWSPRHLEAVRSIEKNVFTLESVADAHRQAVSDLVSWGLIGRAIARDGALLQQFSREAVADIREDELLYVHPAMSEVCKEAMEPQKHADFAEPRIVIGNGRPAVTSEPRNPIRIKVRTNEISISGLGEKFEHEGQPTLPIIFLSAVLIAHQRVRSPALADRQSQAISMLRIVEMIDFMTVWGILDRAAVRYAGPFSLANEALDPGDNVAFSAWRELKRGQAIVHAPGDDDESLASYFLFHLSGRKGQSEIYFFHEAQKLCKSINVRLSMNRRKNPPSKFIPLEGAPRAQLEREVGYVTLTGLENRDVIVHRNL